MDRQFVKFATATAKVAGKSWTVLACLAIAGRPGRHQPAGDGGGQTGRGLKA